MIKKKMLKIFIFVISITLVTISCKSVEKTCFNNKLGWKYNIEKLLDTSRVYIAVDIVDQKKDTNDLFIKNERLLIKKVKPGIKFYSNGKFAYFTETTSINYTEKAIYGQYRVYNDTIQICRQYWSAQAGKRYASKFLIINDKGFIQKGSGDVFLYFEEKEKTTANKTYK